MSTAQLEIHLALKLAPKYVGYHANHKHPFKRTQRVRIPKGTFVKTTNPKHCNPDTGHFGGFILKKDVTVIVRSTGCGQNIPENTYQEDYKHSFPNAPIIDSEYGPVRATHNPTVLWAGSGGYWHEVDVNLVQLVKEK